MAIRFVELIQLEGINPYVPVSAERAGALAPGWRKPMPVRIRVNGQPVEPWAINMMPVGDGGFRLYLHETVRRASGTGVGDEVEVEIAFDEAYRGGPPELPAWFQAALDDRPEARAGWEALPPSRQKEIARYLATLKSAQAQARNLQRALHVLSGGEARFMARDWKDGR